jgi:hypothetical protein
MAVSAAIQFTQSFTTPPAGQSMIGIDGETVTVANGDNTGVTAWNYEMLSVPPGSTVPLGVIGTTPSVTFTPTPGVTGGCYRIRLTVTGAGVAQDIRNFGIPNARGWIIPPFQGNPIPLTFNELNFVGQGEGWAWFGDGARGLVGFILTDIFNNAFSGASGELAPYIFTLSGNYSAAATPGFFDPPRRVKSNRTISSVTLIRRTAGLAGSGGATIIDILRNGFSIFPGPGNMPQVGDGAVPPTPGNNAIFVATTFNAPGPTGPNLTTGDIIEAQLVSKETFFSGPPDGPEGFTVAINFV